MKFDVQVYTTQTSSRLIYAVDVVLGNILGLTYTITDSPEDDTPLINYSYDRSVGGIFIQPEGLLFQEGIRKQEIWIAHLDNIPLFFPQPPEAGFQLDIFAFAFYLVSRYEEYLNIARDEQGRFMAESSLAYKHNFLDIPVVDIWALRLGVTLKLLYPELIIPEKNYNHLMTVDIDEPYKYKGRGLARNLGGLFMDLIGSNKPANRFKCMTGKINDSYDTYGYINDSAGKYNCPVLYFFSAGYKGRYSRNLSPYTRCYEKLIKVLSQKHDVGLQTSYSAGYSDKLIYKEKERLEAASQKEITKLRKHHLMLTLPHVFKVIQDTGIREDYSMGYIREAGFRGGIARPCRFYDLSREETSSLILVPYQYMEETFRKYKRYDPSEAIESIGKLINRTKEVGGLFISIWHNTSLTEEGDWEGWRRVFEYTLKEQC